MHGRKQSYPGSNQPALPQRPSHLNYKPQPPQPQPHIGGYHHRQQLVQQHGYYTDEFGEEWSDGSDDEQYMPPANDYHHHHQEPMGYGWDKPAIPLPNQGHRPYRPPPEPQRPPVQDDDDTYLPIDNDIVPQEIGKGFINPTPAMHSRPPIQPPMFSPPHQPLQPPARPMKPTPQDDLYLPVNENPPHPHFDLPERPPPQKPTVPSPQNSFKDRQSNSSRDSGLGSQQPSRNNSGHFPQRTGSHGSSSGEQTDNEQPSPSQKPSTGFAQIKQNRPKFPAKQKWDAPAMPMLPPFSDNKVSTPIKELSNLLIQGNRSAIGTPHKVGNLFKPDFQNKEPLPVPKRKMPSYEDTVIHPRLSSKNHSPVRSPNDPSPHSAFPPISNQVEDQPWYANVSRDKATERIRSAQKQGAFLVRPGRGQDTPYSLTAYANSKFFNLQIRKRPDNQQYALGTKKSNERTFPSVCAMMEYYMTSSLTLAEGEGSVKLSGPP